MGLTHTEFDELANKALASLPLCFREKLSNLAIEVADEAPCAVLGTCTVGLSPAHIVLYQKAIEETCPMNDDLEATIRWVLYHEIGHYFGLNEAELQAVESHGPHS